MEVIYCQNNQPSIVNYTASWTQDRQTLKVKYDLDDKDNIQHRIDVKIFSLSESNKYLQYNPISSTGDIGSNVTNGNNKEIILSFANTIPDKVVIKLTADDGMKHNIINNAINNISSTDLMNNLRTLQGKRNANTDPMHLNNSRIFLKNYFEQYFSTEELKMNTPTLQCINYSASQYGFNQPNNIIVIDAHYDSAGNSPGADDNASGVIGVMEAIKVLSPYCSDKTIRYLLFDLEELGLVGSNLYLNNQLSTKDSIKAVINFEMIGYYSEANNTQDLPTGFNVLFPEAYQEVINNNRKGNFITNVGNANSVNLINTYKSNGLKYVPELKIISLNVPGNGSIVPDLRRSDHASFWDKNIPALMITDGANFRNKKYHTVNDSIHYLNPEFMQRVIATAIASIAELAGINEASCVQMVLPAMESNDNDYRINNLIFQHQNELYIDADLSAVSQLALYNQSGQLIFSKNSINTHVLDMDHIIKTSGLYYYTIKINDNIVSGKIILNL